MFSRLRLRLALQVTAIVFVLTLLAGVVFLVESVCRDSPSPDRSLELSAHIAGDVYLPLDAEEAAGSPP